MNKHNFNIKTLGIPKQHVCPNCKKRQALNDNDRRNIAEGIMANEAGMWDLIHCERCGWVDMIYPAQINGIKCTKAECDELHLEMKELEKRADGLK